MAEDRTLWIVGCAGLAAVTGVCGVGAGVLAYFVLADREGAESPSAVAPPAPVVEAPLTREEILALPPEPVIAPVQTFDRRPRTIVARITRVAGNPGVSVGDECRFEVTVEPSSRAPYWCRALVSCNGRRFFGQDAPRRNGFFSCEIYGPPDGVVGYDRSPTTESGDAVFQIDTRQGRMWVIDDEQQGVTGAPYRIEASVSVGAAPTAPAGGSGLAL